MAQAVQRLQVEGKDMIYRAFKQTGISIRPDGVDVMEIRIKGIDRSQIDWANWESTEETYVSKKHEEIQETSLDGLPLFITAEEADKEDEETRVIQVMDLTGAI